MCDKLHEFIQTIVEFYHHPVKLDAALQACAAGAPWAIGIFQETYGIPPAKWAWVFRTALAAEIMVANPDVPLDDIACLTGFGSTALLERVFLHLMDQTPQVFACRQKRLQELEGPIVPDCCTAGDLAPGLERKALERVSRQDPSPFGSG